MRSRFDLKCWSCVSPQSVRPEAVLSEQLGINAVLGDKMKPPRWPRHTHSSLPRRHHPSGYIYQRFAHVENYTFGEKSLGHIFTKGFNVSQWTHEDEAGCCMGQRQIPFFSQIPPASIEFAQKWDVILTSEMLMSLRQKGVNGWRARGKLRLIVPAH